MINTNTGIRTLAAAILAVATGYGHVEISAPKGGEMLNAGSAFIIKWTADDHNCVYNLYYSPDGGTTWQNIALGLAKAVRQHNWTVPSQSTQKGMVRVFQDNATGSDLEGRSKVFMVHGATGIANTPVAGEPSMRFDAASRSIEISLAGGEGMEGQKISLDAFTAQGKLVANLLNEPYNARPKKLSIFSNRLQGNAALVFKLQIGSRNFSHYWNGVR